jgi:hypothetical protein
VPSPVNPSQMTRNSSSEEPCTNIEHLRILAEFLSDHGQAGSYRFVRRSNALTVSDSRIVGHPEVIFEPDLAYAVGWKDGRKQCWGHRGDKKKVFGDGPGAVN